MHNVVGTMCAIPEVKRIIDEVSYLVSYVRTSGLGANFKPTLKRHVETRWNTVHDMLASVLVNYTEIGKILLEKEEADIQANVMPRLTALNRTELEPICSFLKKFKDWSLKLESDKVPTTWMVWTIYEELKEYLQIKSTDTAIIISMKEAGQTYTSNIEADILPKSIHKICTVLHPLLKNIAIASPDDRKAIYELIDQEISKYGDETRAETKSQDEASIHIVNKFMGGCNLANVVSAPIEPVTDEIGCYSLELQKYLKANMEIADPFEFDLCEWWKQHRDAYPRLFRLFISKSGATASSAPSERSFSTTGIIISARRSSLIPDTVSDMVLARNKYLNFV